MGRGAMFQGETIMKRLRVFVSLALLSCLSLSLIACGEPLDRVPMNEFTADEKKQAETRLKDYIWKTYTDPAFAKTFCNMVTISLMYSFAPGGDPAQSPEAGKACTDSVSKCEKSFTEDQEKNKADFDKQEMDFSTCKARYSEVVACVDKMISTLKTDAGGVSCGDTSTWSVLKGYDPNKKLGDCEELMKQCPLAPPSSETTPAPTPDTTP
jgi:hypothetical protein